MIDESWYKRPDGVPDSLSAGGVVVRLERGRLMVALAQELEFDEYVLPKGHVDPGESEAEAARREVEEEVGISELHLVQSLGVLERLGYDKLEWKKTHYFLFATTQVDATPTDTEKHKAMRWFPLDMLPHMLWPEQIELLEKNRDRIVELVNDPR